MHNVMRVVLVMAAPLAPLLAQALPTTVIIARSNQANVDAHPIASRKQGAAPKEGVTARTPGTVARRVASAKTPASARESATAVGTAASGASTMAFAGRSIDEWVALAVDDASLMRRDRTVSALRRAPPAVRAAAAKGMAAALSDPSPDRRVRALQALGQLAAETQGNVARFDGVGDLSPLLSAIVRAARDSSERVRGSAMWLLSLAGVRARDFVRPVVREALGDSSAVTREAAISAVGIVGDSTDVRRLTPFLLDHREAIRAAATVSLGELGLREAVPYLSHMLSDSSRAVRAMALRALGGLGSAARSALPAIASLVTDTSEWRSGSYAASVGEEAAWAASRISPRRGVALVPALVEVGDSASALRSDGLGAYVTGADSVKAYVSAALNLDLAGPRGDGRATRLAVARTLRRSLTFDLSLPLYATGATPLKTVRDNEAVIHVFYLHEHDKKMVSITMLDPTDLAVECQRAEFQFRIDGEPYVLQMGEWSAGEFDTRAPRVNGNGTSTPRILHTTANEWTVFASAASMARLWNVSDPDHPVDRGLYLFPFRTTWTALVPK